ncbi:hypothetical protein GS444_16875, partial [Rhodococcus hoagii]|nr:hypothetical protein [Prescottella equi]
MSSPPDAYPVADRRKRPRIARRQRADRGAVRPPRERSRARNDRGGRQSELHSGPHRSIPARSTDSTPGGSEMNTNDPRDLAHTTREHPGEAI